MWRPGYSTPHAFTGTLGLDRGNPQITAGLIGSVITMVCCFTPALVVPLSAFGFAAVIGYLDYVLFPALAIFLGLIVYGWWIKPGCAAENKTSGCEST
jgi:mercuric ion transport protein